MLSEWSSISVGNDASIVWGSYELIDNIRSNENMFAVCREE